MGVSIVIPFHGDGRYFEACLDSIRAQRVPGVEVVVVDDASPVPAGPLLDPWRDRLDINSVRLPENRGTFVARKRGIARARHPWITFLDPDDILLPGALSTLVETVETQSADIAALAFMAVHEDDRIEPYGWAPDAQIVETGADAIEGLLLHRPNGQAGKLYRAELCARLHEVWPAEPHLVFAEDLLFNVIVMGLARTVVWTPHRLYGYRQHDQSIMQSSGVEQAIALSRQVDDIFDTIETILPRLDLPKDRLEQLQLQLQERRWRSQYINLLRRTAIRDIGSAAYHADMTHLRQARPELAGPMLAMSSLQGRMRDATSRRIRRQMDKNRDLRTEHLATQRRRHEEEVAELRQRIDRLTERRWWRRLWSRLNVVRRSGRADSAGSARSSEPPGSER